MQATTAQRVQKHRAGLRASGLKPIQIWVPDTKRKGFAAECYRQSVIAAKSDVKDIELFELMDEALDDIDGWTP